ncbi:MAG: hypothetical protein AAFN04_15670, partial [Pseudomonadota bacterium]
MAIGLDAEVETNAVSSIAIGESASIIEGTDFAIAIGRGALVQGRDVDLSEDDDTVGNFGIAIGDSAALYGSESVVLGAGANVSGNQSLAIGANSQVGRFVEVPGSSPIDLPVHGSVAIGGDFDGDGLGAYAQHDNSVALGADSTTSAENTVSVGRVDDIATGEDETIRRRIMNVDDGVLRTDAATVGQVADAVAAANPYIAINSSGTTPMATGENAIAIGQESNVGADTEGSLAIGLNSSVRDGSDHSMAFGQNATVLGGTEAFDQFGAPDPDGVGNFNLGIGAFSYVEGGNSSSVGGGAFTIGLGATAVGHSAGVQGDFSLSSGYSAYVSGDQSIALGSFSTVNGGPDPLDDLAPPLPASNAIAIGGDGSGDGVGAFAGADAAIAFGADAASLGESSLAIGQYATVTEGTDFSIAIGGDADGDLVGAQAMHANSIALGADSVTEVENSLSLGDSTNGLTRRIMNVSDGVLRTDAATVGQVADAVAAGNPLFAYSGDDNAATTSGERAIAIGPVAEADGDAALAIGARAQASGVQSLAIGSSAVSEPLTRASHANAIAIGAGSQTSAENTVSFGTSGNERRLTHIDDGVENTDAVTVRQLNAAIASAGGGGGSTTSYLEVNSMGTLPSAEGTDSIALGARASTSTDAEDGVAIGSDASVTAVNAVALGADSVADEDDTVSFGSDTVKRKLTNLAEGEADDDAATYGQLTDLTQTVSNNTS